MPDNGPALLRMSDIELLGIIRDMFETIDRKTTDRKFDVQTRHTADDQSCKTNRDLKARPHVETKPTFPIILILAQTKSIYQIIIIIVVVVIIIIPAKKKCE